MLFLLNKFIILNVVLISTKFKSANRDLLFGILYSNPEGVVVKLLYVAILVAVISAVPAFLFLNYYMQPTGELTYKENSIVTVGGEEITSGDVDNQFDAIPEEQKQDVTKDDILNAMIDQKLVLQEAEKNGVSTTDGEIDTYIQQVKAAHNINGEELEKYLAGSGYTLEEYKDSLREQIIISKFLTNELHLQNVSVSDSDVENFIEQNKEEFQFVFDEQDPDLEAQLRGRLRYKLMEEKQKELVSDYLESLRSRAEIREG